MHQQVDSSDMGHAGPHNVTDDTPPVHSEEDENENVSEGDVKRRHPQARRICSEVVRVMRSDHLAEC